MNNTTAADSSQSNISRIYIWKDNSKIKNKDNTERTTTTTIAKNAISS